MVGTRTTRCWGVARCHNNARRRNADEHAERACDLASAQGGLRERMRKSYYRSYERCAWGSLEWLHAFIAMGSLPTSFVDIVRRLCADRKARAPAQVNPCQNRRVQRTEPERGIQHKAAEAKRLRERGKLLDKEIKRQRHLWERGDRCMSREAWNRLVADADRAWEVALKASYEAGNPFNDREGVRRCDHPRDLVGLALREWCANHNLKYDWWRPAKPLRQRRATRSL